MDLSPKITPVLIIIQEEIAGSHHIFGTNLILCPYLLILTTLPIHRQRGYAMNKRKLAGVLIAAVLLTGVLSWMFTAPYLGNEGLARAPGVLIGGTPTPSLDDFTPLNERFPGPIRMKQTGFPPFVTYLSWVGTPDGVITATHPDGAFWAQQVRDHGGDGWLRIGEATFTMEAIEIFGDERIAMMGQWAAMAGITIDDSLYEGAEPLRNWEVFFWKPK
jgi:CubicO group peptidase (beta-lactamase class C family)